MKVPGNSRDSTLFVPRLMQPRPKPHGLIAGAVLLVFSIVAVASGPVRAADPTANAGTDFSVNEEDTATFAGSGDDTDATDNVTFGWEQTDGSPTVTLSGATTTTPSFLAPNLTANATLTFKLTVTSSNASDPEATDEVKVTIVADNDDPTAEAGTAQTVSEDDGTVTLSGSGSDPEDETLTYGWSPPVGSTVTLTNADMATATFEAPNLTGNTVLTFTLTVTAGGASVTDTVDVTITADNDPPTADAGTDLTVSEASTVTLSGTGSSDPEEEDLSYDWVQTAGTPTVNLLNADSATPSFTAPNLTGIATLTFTLTVTAAGDPTSATAMVKVTIRGQNSDPVARAGADQTVAKGAVVRLSGSGSDSEGQTVTYSWSQTGGSPTVTLWNAGSASAWFNAPSLLSDATLTFTLTVTAGGASVSDTVEVTISSSAIGLYSTKGFEFSDVAVDNVHAGAIAAVAEAGIILGCSEDGTRFCPDDLVTRAEMASFLVRGLGLGPSEKIDRFSDVAVDNVHAGAIAAVAEAGIALGCSEDGTRFCPDDLVTRAEMASFLVRGLGLGPSEKIDRFSDVAVDNVHAGAIGAVAEAGITLGCSADGTRFCPDDLVTRAQMASFMARSVGLPPKG